MKDVNSLFTVIAHSTIYRSRASTNSTLPSCESGVCQGTVYFQWLGDNTCKSNAICTKLEENPCEDYGLMIGYPERQYENNKKTIIKIIIVWFTGSRIARQIFCKLIQWLLVRFWIHLSGTLKMQKLTGNAISGVLRLEQFQFDIMMNWLVMMILDYW